MAKKTKPNNDQNQLTEFVAKLKEKNKDEALNTLNDAIKKIDSLGYIVLPQMVLRGDLPPIPQIILIEKK